jgi:hypothetical protein
LKVPNDREPPQGGVAKHSFDEPEKWKPLGDLLWHCNLDGTDIWRQRFEHGTIIGPFRINPNDDGGVLYILFDDQTWQKELGKQPAPKFWPVVWASA